MLVNFTFIGIMAPVFTIFSSDFSLNTDPIPQYAHYLLDSGINGIQVAGTTGEGPSLTFRERKILAEAWVATAKHTFQHIQVQIGGAPFFEVIELAKHAESIGVDSLLVLPELYFKPQTVQELIKYLKAIGGAAPRTPLLYYHYPDYTGVNLNMVELIELGSKEIPTLRGMKYTSNDMTSGYAAFKAAKRVGYTILMGVDYLVEPAFATGYTAATASSVNVFPKYVTGIFKAINNNRLKMARSLHRNLTDIMDVVSKYGRPVAVLKLAMNLFGPFNVGLARPPIENPGPHSVQPIKRLIEPLL